MVSRRDHRAGAHREWVTLAQTRAALAAEATRAASLTDAAAAEWMSAVAIRGRPDAVERRAWSWLDVHTRGRSGRAATV